MSPGPVERALRGALHAADLTPVDAAAKALATNYARLLDRGADATKVGPALLAALEALGMTPRARAALLGKGKPGDGPARSPLDELRERRRARANGTPHLDAPAAGADA